MFLTRMSLNPARRGTRSLVSSPQRMHAAVLSSFPPDAAAASDDEGRVLWRVDRGDQHRLTLYVSGPRKPDLTHVVEQAGWPSTGETWQTADYAAFLERLDVGQRWVFRLTANPVRDVSQGEGRPSKRTAHVTIGHQEEWFLGRAAGCGFAVTTNELDDSQLVVSQRQSVRFTRRTPAGAGTVTLATATYDGVLEVRDADLLRAALRRGIGRAKGYGCGLLTLARP